MFFWTWNAPAHEPAWSLQRALANGWLRPSDIKRARERIRARATGHQR
jgi:hypothetical protein